MVAMVLLYSCTLEIYYEGDQQHEPSESAGSMNCSLQSTQLHEQQAPEPQEQPATQQAGHHHKTHAKRIPIPTPFQIPSATLLAVFLCLAVALAATTATG